MPLPSQNQHEQEMSLINSFPESGIQNNHEYLLKGIEALKDYAIFMLDAGGFIQTWNSGAQQTHGYSAAEIIGQHYSKLYLAEAVDQDDPRQKLIWAAQHKGFSDEGWQLRKDGSLFWVNVSITPLAENEQLAGFCVVIRDLTAKKMAEESLRQAEERFRLMVEGVKDYAIFMLDPEGYIITWNEGAERIKGYKPDEIIGQHFSKFYPQEAIARQHPQFELRVAKAEGRFEEEAWRVRKDGSLFWANVIITALYNRNKELIGFAKVTRDLTERKKILDQLQRAKDEMETLKESYRMLIENVKDYAILMLDPKGVIRSWNSGAERIMGYKATEIINQHFSKFYRPEEVEEGKCEFELQYAELEGVFEEEGLRVRKNGDLFWASVVITALRNETNELIGFSKITRDITERKNSEQAMRENEKRYRMMADKVIQRSKEFQILNKQLEAINRELETFSYSVSHDLRAPLRNINGFARLVLEDKADQLDTEAMDYLEKVCSSTDQMAGLIEDLLKLSRLSRKELRYETVNLTLLAQDILNDLQTQDPQRQVEVDITDPMEVTADAGLIRIALQNLLSNAWKFTGNKEKAFIEFGIFQQDSGENTFFVRDNGVGFDMNYASALFGAFQRLHTADEFSGTGIGLATVERIIHRHGGRIWADAKVDQGAIFYFTLPGKEVCI